jgi:short-subunit dehydrogenase
MNILIIGIGNLGFELAKMFKSNDNKLILISRSVPDYAVEFVKESNVFHIKGDATSFDEMQTIAKSNVFQEVGDIDTMIITPGLATSKTFINDFQEFKECFEFNYFAYVCPLKSFLKHVAIGARLIMISATSAHHADKRLSGYPASKWALENIFSSLREELRPRNITVDVIAVRTIKNKYSKVWLQENGESPEKIAAYIQSVIISPKNKRHFIPRYYSMFRIVERIAPFLLDLVHGLSLGFVRCRKFKFMQSERVLITGASSGLGRALSIVYAKSAKALYLCDIDEEGLKNLKEELLSINSSCTIHCFKVDVSDENKIKELIDEIDIIDLLINNVGVRFQGTVEDTSIEQYYKNLQLNFYSHLLFISLFFNKAIPPKKIINVLSTTAIRGRSLHALYSSAKGAMWNCSRSLRRVYGNSIQIIEAIPSGMSNTKLVENSIVTRANSVSKKIKDELKVSSTVSLQSRFGFLKISDYSANDAATQIIKMERNGKEVLYLPPVRASLFMLLELMSSRLFFKVFKR